MLFTFIARLTDGMPLFQSVDNSKNEQNAVIEEIQRQAKMLLSTVDSRTAETRSQIEAGSASYCYSIHADDNLFILVSLTDKGYPRRLAFSFMEDVRVSFLSEIKAEKAAGLSNSSIDLADKPFAFMRYERSLVRIRKEYIDPSSSSNATRLKEELSDIRNIMRKNIAEVLDRGEKLEHVSKISSKLVSESKKFKWGAKKLNAWDALQKALPWVVAVVGLAFIIYYRFFL
jgi:vesicle transport protein SEC22